MKMNKRKVDYTLGLLLSTLFLISLTVNHGIAEQSDGTADVENTAPVVSNPAFTDVFSVSKDASQIDVQTEYWISYLITDSNRLQDLTDAVFKIWGPTTTEAGADSEVNHYTFKYTQTSDQWTEVGPDAGGSHLVTVNCTDPADQSVKSGTFRLAFKLAKIAEHTNTATWSIKIIVTDDYAATDTDQTLTFGVTFYCELAIGDTSHSWTGLKAGDTDKPLNYPADGDIDVTVTANAIFDVQARGSGDLSTNGYTILLANVKIHKDTLGTAVSLTNSFADVVGLTNQPAGADLAKSFMLWITVPDPQPKGTYSYTLYVSIEEPA